MWIFQCCVLLILGFICAHGQDEQVLMLPNRRTSLDDCHLRFHKLTRHGLASSAYGHPARSKEFAHMGAIGWTKANGSIAWDCAGSLIWPNFVLTAAHCAVDADNKAPDVVRFGDLNMTAEATEGDEQAQQLNIVEILKHPEYSPEERYHDIALLKLEQNVTLSDVVVPACLWTDEEIRFNILEAGFVEKQTPVLQKVAVKPIENEECSEVYSNWTDNKLQRVLQKHQICAVDENMDTCEGEPGGPLQIKLMHNARMSPFVVGITSFRTDCGEFAPGVYTRVAPYHDWIIETLQKHGAMVSDDIYNATFCALRYASFREYEDASIMSRSNSFVTVVNGKNHVHVQNGLPSYIAQLVWDGETNDCYGVIIDENTVVTLAQCVTKNGMPATHIKYLNKEQMNVSTIHVHPKYIQGSSFNNIAILRLQNLLVVEDIDPACLWHEESPSLDVHVHGYGRIDINSVLWIKRLVEPIDPSLSFLTARVRFQNASTCIIPKRYLPLLGDGLTNEHICNGQNMFLVPESCELVTGGAVHDTVYRVGNNYPMVYGLNYLGRDCGFGEHSIAIGIAGHIGWMKSVLIANNQQSQTDITRIVESDSHDGDICDKKDGLAARCVALSKCSRAWKSLSLKETVELCADSSSVCCPLDKIVKTDRKEVYPLLDECPNVVKNLNTTSPGGTLVFISLASNVEQFRCLGTIITERIILTSASCIGDEEPATVKLVANTTQNIYRVDALLVHYAYNATDNTNDIAMIRLEDKLVWSSDLFPSCLWSNTTHVPLVLTMISPVTEETLHPSRTVGRSNDVITDFGKILNLKVLAMYNSDCQRSHTNDIHDSQLCARNPFKNNTCTTMSDQLRYDSNGISYVVGLSTNFYSCEHLRYSVFARISEFVSWIGMNI